MDDRSDSQLAAYALGTDRSGFTGGTDVNLTLSGDVSSTAEAGSVGFVARSSSTNEVAGSRDSSSTATNPGGQAISQLASRSYGIDDAGLSELSSADDFVEAGSDLSLAATATGSNQLRAETTGNDSIGSFTLHDFGAAANDRLRSTATGDDFLLINGDRIRFTSSSGGVLADRDYYVVNVIPEANVVTAPFYAEFQISTLPGGEAIEITAGGPLQAYRPAVAYADGLSTATAINLDRSGASAGIEAGSDGTITATASHGTNATARSVAGDAVAGLNRLGGADGVNVVPISAVSALNATSTDAAGDLTQTLSASNNADLSASSTDGEALTEANGQVPAPAVASPALAMLESPNWLMWVRR